MLDWRKHIRRDTSFATEIYPAFWVMDDHRWAYFAWEKSAHDLKKNKRFSLIHADYHYDGCNDFENDEEISSLRAMRELNAVEALVRTDTKIRKDSFIAPAVIRELLSSVHFYCLQDDTEPGIDSTLLARFNCAQYMHTSTEQLVGADVSSPMIFDLCLDLFNDSDQWEEGELWEDRDIIEFLELTAPYIERASIVTVSFSYGYSGSKDDTEHLAAIVLPRMLALRGVAT